MHVSPPSINRQEAKWQQGSGGVTVIVLALPIVKVSPYEGLTMDGRSQHLSLLVQARLQIMSNIWSWNCATEPKTNVTYVHGVQ